MTTAILARFGATMKWLLVAVALSSLGACASGAGHRNMTVMPTDVKDSAVPVELQRTIGIGSVSGGEETNPLWTSEVSNEEFKQALHDSLDGLKLYSGAADSRYVLDVHLLNLDQPLMGFDTTVTSSVKYVLSERATKRSVIEELVVAAHTATVSDAFYGVERLKLANEGSIRDNIAEFIRRLSKRLPEQTPESTTVKPTT